MMGIDQIFAIIPPVNESKMFSAIKLKYFVDLNFFLCANISGDLLEVKENIFGDQT